MALGNHLEDAVDWTIAVSERMAHFARGVVTPRRRAVVVSLAVVAVCSVLLAIGRGIADPVVEMGASSGATKTVQIQVAEDGLYELTASALESIGFDLVETDHAALLLTKDGFSVPFQIVGSGPATSLRFFGKAPSATSYGAQAVYWLTNSNPVDSLLRGRAVTSRDATSAGAASDVATVMIHLEEQQHVSPKTGPAEDRWFWQSLLAPARTEIAFDAPGATGQNVRLNMRFWGNTSASQDPDHHVVLLLNDTPIGDLRWDGIGGHEEEVQLPPALLAKMNNRLEIELVGDTGAPADAVLLDWVDVTYQRNLELRSGEHLRVSSETAGALAVKTSVAGACVWDVAAPAAPVVLDGIRDDGKSITFAAGSPGSVYYIADSAALLKPERMIAGDDLLAKASRLQRWPGGADLMIVTIPAFHEALAPLVAAREADGLRVALIDVEDAYAAFSAGEPTPMAIRALVQQAMAAWASPAPRFLLLAGDASYDSRDYLGGAEHDLVPTQLVDTTFTGWTASDVWYALPDDNPNSLPQIAVGRLPAQTIDEMVAMVAKTLRYSGQANSGTVEDSAARSWNRKAFLLADNDDPEFALVAQDFGDWLKEYDSERIVVTGDGLVAHQRLLEALSEGVGLVGYFGHGSISLWAQEKVFSVDDAVKLRNEGRLPLLFTVTCLSGFFQHPEVTSLGEAMVRQARGGAVAALVPSSAGLLPDQRLLTDRFAAALDSASTTDQTLGELLLQAQRDMPGTSEGARQTLLTFNLLGDPSLHYPSVVASP